MTDSQQFLFAVIFGLTLLVDLWAVILVFRRPSYAFDEAGKSKVFWIITILLGILVCNVGFLVSLWYLFMVDPKVRNMQRLGGQIGFPGGP